MHSLFETPEARCFYDSSLPALVVEWRKSTVSGAFRGVLDGALAGWQRLNAGRGANDPPLGWLADTTRFSVLSPLDQRWLCGDWHTRVVASGVGRMAFVVPTNVLGQMSVNYYLAYCGHGQAHLPRRLFATTGQARAWLRHSYGGLDGRGDFSANLTPDLDADLVADPGAGGYFAG